MKVSVYDIPDCTSCKGKHTAVHVLTEVGVNWYFCPQTEDRVPLSIEPLEPA